MVAECLISNVEVLCKFEGTALLEREDIDEFEERMGVNVDEGPDSMDVVDVSAGLLPVANRSLRRSTSHLHLGKCNAKDANT